MLLCGKNGLFAPEGPCLSGAVCTDDEHRDHVHCGAVPVASRTQACETLDDRACSVSARQILRCSEAGWVVAESCSEDDRCRGDGSGGVACRMD